jgi:hypothetical protein
VSKASKSRDEYDDLVSALRGVFPSPDYRDDEHVRRTWDSFLGELTEVLERKDPDFEASTFVMEVIARPLGPDGKGPSKRERRIGVFIWSVPILILLWAFHSNAVDRARAEGHSDIFALLCQQKPAFAADFLPIDEEGMQYTCKDFEHHFDED